MNVNQERVVNATYFFKDFFVKSSIIVVVMRQDSLGSNSGSAVY